MSPIRRTISLVVGFLLAGSGIALFANWLFFGGGLPKYVPVIAATMLGLGLVILYEDIKDLRSRK